MKILLLFIIGMFVIVGLFIVSDLYDFLHDRQAFLQIKSKLSLQAVFSFSSTHFILTHLFYLVGCCCILAFAIRHFRRIGK